MVYFTTGKSMALLLSRNPQSSQECNKQISKQIKTNPRGDESTNDIYIYMIYVKYVQIHTLYKYTGFRGVHGSPKRLAHIGVDRLCHAACLDTLGPLHITRKGQLLRAAATARLYLYMPHSCHNSDSNCNWRVSLQTVSNSIPFAIEEKTT